METVYCSECGSSRRPKSVNDPTTCIRCTGEEDVQPVSARLSMRGAYDGPVDLGPGQGGVLVEEFHQNRRKDAATWR
jgi:hypothetical protein